MRINTNISAMNTYSRLTSANTAKSGSLAKLSSGLRINKAGDDAAGLAISEKMKNQISGLTQASRNAQDGISLIQTAEGALSETHNILNRMRDLTVQAANGTNTDDDRSAIQSEINSLTEEIDRIAGTTTFNTQGLMDGVNFTETALDNHFANTGKTLDENILLSDAIRTVKPGSLTGDANSAVETDVIATALNSLTEDEVDAVLSKYNNDKATAIATDKAKNVAAKVDFDDVAPKYGISVAAAAAPNADELKALEDAIISAEKEKPLSKSDLGDAKATEFTFQIGANAGENIKVSIESMSSKGLKVGNVNVSDNADFDAELKKLDEAVKLVSEQRANLGAVQNRLDHTVSNLSTTKENLSEANSRIVDVDMAEEMMSFTKNNILSQAATSMLAQANQMPQGVLSLLQ